MDAILFFPFFIGLWCLVSLLISLFSGWHSAAKIYKNNSEIPEKEYYFQSARINIANYNGCLRFGKNGKGLLIRVFFFFRLGHPPLFIPWDEIKIEDSSIMFFIKTKTITFKRYDGMRLRISQNLAKKLFEGTTFA